MSMADSYKPVVGIANRAVFRLNDPIKTHPSDYLLSYRVHPPFLTILVSMS